MKLDYDQYIQRNPTWEEDNSYNDFDCAEINAGDCDFVGRLDCVETEVYERTRGYEAQGTRWETVCPKCGDRLSISEIEEREF